MPNSSQGRRGGALGPLERQPGLRRGRIKEIATPRKPLQSDRPREPLVLGERVPPGRWEWNDCPYPNGSSHSRHRPLHGYRAKSVRFRSTVDAFRIRAGLSGGIRAGEADFRNRFGSRLASGPCPNGESGSVLRRYRVTRLA